MKIGKCKGLHTGAEYDFVCVEKTQTFIDEMRRRGFNAEYTPDGIIIYPCKGLRNPSIIISDIELKNNEIPVVFYHSEQCDSYDSIFSMKPYYAITLEVIIPNY